MSLSIILVLIILGLILLLIEILILPGTAIIGLAGIGFIIASVYSAYHSLGTEMGHIILSGTIVTSILVIYLSLRSNTWKKLMLKTELTGKVPNLAENLIKIGDHGNSSSRLAPIGKALINEQYVEVHSVEGFVDENQEITVVQIETNKIFVKLKNTK
jgi:membrane-bound ClpP family serine protease